MVKVYQGVAIKVRADLAFIALQHTHPAEMRARAHSSAAANTEEASVALSPGCCED